VDRSFRETARQPGYIVGWNVEKNAKPPLMAIAISAEAEEKQKKRKPVGGPGYESRSAHHRPTGLLTETAFLLSIVIAAGERLLPLGEDRAL